jgi:hypothetical protein
MQQQALSELFGWLHLPGASARSLAARTRHVWTVRIAPITLVVFADPVGRTALGQQDIVRCARAVLRVSSVTRSATIVVFLVPSLLNYSKRLPRDTGLIQRTDINSGLCISRPAGGATIYIYRNQEIRKVLLHELLHAVGVHASSESSPDLTRYKTSILERMSAKRAWIRDLQPQVLLYEAVVEAIACVLEAGFRNLDAPSDIAHSRNLCALLLRWGDAQAARDRVSTNTTHAIEYILLKHVLYVEWLRAPQAIALMAPFDALRLTDVARHILASPEFQRLCAS